MRGLPPALTRAVHSLSARAAVTRAAACIELIAGSMVGPLDGGIVVSTVVGLASGLLDGLCSAGSVGTVEIVCRGPGFRTSKGDDLKGFSNPNIFSAGSNLTSDGSGLRSEGTGPGTVAAMQVRMNASETTITPINNNDRASITDVPMVVDPDAFSVTDQTC